MTVFNEGMTMENVVMMDNLGRKSASELKEGERYVYFTNRSEMRQGVNPMVRVACPIELIEREDHIVKLSLSNGKVLKLDVQDNVLFMNPFVEEFEA